MISERNKKSKNFSTVIVVKSLIREIRTVPN
jgi:hypothetical protein